MHYGPADSLHQSAEVSTGLISNNIALKDVIAAGAATGSPAVILFRKVIGPRTCTCIRFLILTWAAEREREKERERESERERVC